MVKKLSKSEKEYSKSQRDKAKAKFIKKVFEDKPKWFKELMEYKPRKQLNIEE